MKKLVTLAFYEYPAALHDIKEWERLVYDKTIYKSYSSDRMDIVYVLDKSKDNDKILELVVCTPIQGIDDCHDIIKKYDDIMPILHSKHVGYFNNLYFSAKEIKVLNFGKVNENFCQAIVEFFKQMKGKVV